MKKNRNYNRKIRWFAQGLLVKASSTIIEGPRNKMQDVTYGTPFSSTYTSTKFKMTGQMKGDRARDFRNYNTLYSGDTNLGERSAYSNWFDDWHDFLMEWDFNTPTEVTSYTYRLVSTQGEAYDSSCVRNVALYAIQTIPKGDGNNGKPRESGSIGDSISVTIFGVHIDGTWVNH